MKPWIHRNPVLTHPWLRALLVLLALTLGFAGTASARPGFDPQASMSVADLPPEGRDVLQRMERGGPFRYAKDSTVFGNRAHRSPRSATRAL